MRPLLLASLLLSVAALTACSGSGKSIAGTWTAMRAKAKLTLVAETDGAFHITDASNSSSGGRWQSDGNVITLFRDVRNTGNSSFGDADDNAKYDLSADGRTLTSEVKDPTSGPLVFHKQ